MMHSAPLSSFLSVHIHVPCINKYPYSKSMVKICLTWKELQGHFCYTEFCYINKTERKHVKLLSPGPLGGNHYIWLLSYVPFVNMNTEGPI